MTKTATVHAQQRWEYMSISRKTDTYLAQELVVLGQEGWELVTASYARGKKDEMFWTAFLKRPAVGHAVPGTSQEATPARYDPAPASPEPTGPTPGPTSEEAKKDPAGFDLEGEMFAIHEESDKQQ